MATTAFYRPSLRAEDGTRLVCPTIVLRETGEGFDSSIAICASSARQLASETNDAALRNELLGAAEAYVRDTMQPT